MTPADRYAAAVAAIADRQRRLHEGMALPPYAVRLGASNVPHDCQIWASNWRQHLELSVITPDAADDQAPASSELDSESLPHASTALLESARRTGYSGPS